MIRNHSHFSLLRGYGTPEQIVAKAKELGYSYCGLTDYQSISGCIDFYEECIKEEVKPVLGCDFGDFTLIAKNRQGWNELIEILSVDEPNFAFSDNLIRLNHVVGVEAHKNSIELLPKDCQPAYYIEESDKEIHQILISIKINVSIPDIEASLASGSNDHIEYAPYFLSKDFSMKRVNPFVDLIADTVEEFDILSKPRLPKFDCPDDQSEIEYLRELCRVGWKEKLSGIIGPEKVEEYRDRILRELDVIEKADLAGYFLIVQDFMRQAGEDGTLKAIGRGSAAGSMVSYLVGITGIDPIKYGLLFERFYNFARSYPRHVNFEEYKFIDDFRDK